MFVPLIGDIGAYKKDSLGAGEISAKLGNHVKPYLRWFYLYNLNSGLLSKSSLYIWVKRC